MRKTIMMTKEPKYVYNNVKKYMAEVIGRI